MLKIAVAGCGLISVKKHIPAFLRLRNKVNLVAICDLNEDAVRKVAKEFHIKKAYSNFSDMLAQEKPDMVSICTPPGTHAGLAIQAMEKGAHVLIEKPMATEISDCDAVIEAAAKYQKKICVMHNQIFNPSFSEAKERFLKGEIGDFLGLSVFLSTPVDYITSKQDHWAHRLPGGVLGETGPHVVYLVQEFLKDIQDVQISARKILPQYPWSEFEDFRINLIAENGTGSIILVYGSNQWAASLEIIGSKGRLGVDLEAHAVLKYIRPELSAISIGVSRLNIVCQILYSLLKNSLKYISGGINDGHSIGINKFVNSILENKPTPVSAIDGKENMRLMQMIIEKFRSFNSSKA